jgi:hypothetical protein
MVVQTGLALAIANYGQLKKGKQIMKTRNESDNYHLDHDIALIMNVSLDFIDALPLATVENLREGLWSYNRQNLAIANQG